MDFHKDEEIMDVPLIIKQVCQQLGLMEVMQRGSGPERGPLGSGGGERLVGSDLGRGAVRSEGFSLSMRYPIMLSKLFCALLAFRKPRAATGFCPHRLLLRFRILHSNNSAGSTGGHFCDLIWRNHAILCLHGSSRHNEKALEKLFG